MEKQFVSSSINIPKRLFRGKIKRLRFYVSVHLESMLFVLSGDGVSPVPVLQEHVALREKEQVNLAQCNCCEAEPTALPPNPNASPLQTQYIKIYIYMKSW